MIRFVPAVLYLLVVGVCAYLVGTRLPSTAHTVAATDLQVNHLITESDLLPKDHLELIGRYLQVEVGVGKDITPEMVRPDPVYAGVPNMIAAIISVPKRTVMEQDIHVGSKVLICRGDTAFGPAATVISSRCGEALTCSLTISLPKATTSVDPEALAGSTVVATPLRAKCGAQ